MGSLQRTIDLDGTSEDAFIAYKDRLIDYLERFIQDLVTIGAPIARLLRDDDRAGSHAAGRLAVDEAADAAPDPETPRPSARSSAHAYAGATAGRAL